MDVIINISIAIASGAGGAGLIYLASKTAITEKIKGKIKSDYDHKLEEFKAALKGDYDAKIEHVKSAFQRDNLILDTVLRTQNDISRTSHTKRVDVIETLWRNFLLTHKSLDKINTIDSILYVSEFATILDNIPERQAFAKQAFGSISTETFTNLVELHDEIEAIRPFITSKIWLNIEFIHVFSGRIMYLYEKVYKTKDAVHWKNDKTLMRLCENHLTPEEFKAINNGDMAGITLVRSFITQKILNEINIMLTGKYEMHDSIKYAKLTTDLANALSSVDDKNPFI